MSVLADGPYEVRLSRKKLQLHVGPIGVQLYAIDIDAKDVATASPVANFAFQSLSKWECVGDKVLLAPKVEKRVVIVCSPGESRSIRAAMDAAAGAGDDPS